MKILFIEDNIQRAKMVIKLLESKGHKIIHEPSCDSALQLALKDSFDVIMVNVSMEGCTKLDIIIKLRDNGIIRNTHVITWSNEKVPRQEEELKKSGVEYCFTLPTNPNVLLEVLESFNK